MESNSSLKLISDIEKVLLGKPDAVRLAVSCFIAEGHLLIDDIPGVGKTTLGLTMARSIGCTFQRIQFTSDLLPSDVLGVSVYNSQSREFDFKPGPIFHNVILADEINRASPKTQSALLEAMQEGQVSLDNETHELPRPFFVIATQNPHEHYGTFPLPESQLDRFMMRISLGYPSPEVESNILKGDTQDKIDLLSTSGSPAALLEEIEKAKRVAVDESLTRYMIDIAQMTRQSDLIELGLSPRGTLALKRASQAYARTHARDYVIPDDIKAVAVAVMAHRLRFRSANFNGQAARTAEALVIDLLNQVSVPA